MSPQKRIRKINGVRRTRILLHDAENGKISDGQRESIIKLWFETPTEKDILARAVQNLGKQLHDFSLGLGMVA